MRKTKRCTTTKIENRTYGLRMRSCIQARSHEGDHLDEHGRWKEES